MPIVQAIKATIFFDKANVKAANKLSGFLRFFFKRNCIKPDLAEYDVEIVTLEAKV